MGKDDDPSDMLQFFDSEDDSRGMFPDSSDSDDMTVDLLATTVRTEELAEPVLVEHFLKPASAADSTVRCCFVAFVQLCVGCGLCSSAAACIWRRK